MNRAELEQALKEVQSKLPEGTFLVVEKECVEVYHTNEFLPTPVPNNIAPLC